MIIVLIDNTDAELSLYRKILDSSRDNHREIDLHPFKDMDRAMEFIKNSPTTPIVIADDDQGEGNVRGYNIYRRLMNSDIYCAFVLITEAPEDVDLNDRHIYVLNKKSVKVKLSSLVSDLMDKYKNLSEFKNVERILNDLKKSSENINQKIGLIEAGSVRAIEDSRRGMEVAFRSASLTDKKVEAISNSIIRHWEKDLRSGSPYQVMRALNIFFVLSTVTNLLIVPGIMHFKELL